MMLLRFITSAEIKRRLEHFEPFVVVSRARLGSHSRDSLTLLAPLCGTGTCCRRQKGLVYLVARVVFAFQFASSLVLYCCTAYNVSSCSIMSKLV